VQVPTHLSFIHVATKVAALHHWPGAPESRAYLGHPHRHDFEITVTIPVQHDNRDVEFHDALDRLMEIIDDMLTYNDDTLMYETPEIANFMGRSCEMIGAEVLAAWPEAIICKVAEDDRVSASVHRRDSEVSVLSTGATLQDLGVLSDRPAYGSAGIVTLCGSTKFKERTLELEELYLTDGWCVLRVENFPHADSIPISAETKRRLDELHLEKISISDRIHVVNVNGYVGESTQNEIQHATNQGITIVYDEPTYRRLGVPVEGSMDRTT
jgi:hypothetical protein